MLRDLLMTLDKRYLSNYQVENAKLFLSRN